MSKIFVHGDRATEQDRAELVTVHLLSDGGTGVAAQVGDGHEHVRITTTVAKGFPPTTRSTIRIEHR